MKQVFNVVTRSLHNIIFYLIYSTRNEDKKLSSINSKLYIKD